MQIYVNQLSAHLKQLNAVYMVLGDEPLQKMQSVDAIRQACFKQGFDERISLLQDQNFRWSDLTSSGQNLSLFSTRQLIELELTSLKPGQEGSKALNQFLDHQSSDTILLIHGPKAPSEVQKSKWFKRLEQAGLFVSVNQPQGRHFTQWLSQAASSKGLSFEQDALNKFGLMFEGNLLAADQELEKLSLAIGQQRITNSVLKDRVTNQARYNLFELQDAFLAGNSPKALRILASLQDEASEPQLLFWAFSREVELLISLKAAQKQRIPLTKIYQQARVWQSRQALFEQTLRRLSLEQLLACSTLVADIERAIKVEFTTPWDLLCQLVLKLCGQDR